MDGLVVGGKYHVVQPLAHGGMGTVYDAIHAKTGRRVALKLIHERLVTSDGGRMRFEREARAAATIDSLHVVQILDSGEDETSGMPFIVMEFLQGEDLRSLMKRAPLPERLAITIALQICLGLKKAHENDIVHRDLKPANVFIAKTDDHRRVVKLVDFGIAKLVAEGTGSTVDVTATNDVVGSPPYMSPEQLRSPRDVDALTDVWSLGVVLYEMLSGQTPTASVESIGARVYAICHTPVQPLRNVAAHVSPKLAAVVHRALEIEKSKRFASIDEMLTALRSVSSRADILEEDIAFPAVGTAVTSLAAATSVDAEPRAHRSGWLFALVGAGLLAVLGMLGTLAATASRARTGHPPDVDLAQPSVATSSPASSPAASASAVPSEAPMGVSPVSKPKDHESPRKLPVGAGSTKRVPDGRSVQPRLSATQDGREQL